METKFVSPLKEYESLLPPSTRERADSTAEALLSPYYNPIVRVAFTALLVSCKTLAALVDELKAVASPWGYGYRVFRPANIYLRSSYFSKYFDFESPGDINHTVEKLALQLQATYTLFHGKAQAGQGISPLFSLGSFLSCLKKISCYDDQGAYIGCLSGTLFTTSRGKFYIYDKEGAHKATLLISEQGATIVSPESSRLPIASLHQSLKDGAHYWSTQGASSNLIDSRLLEILSAFIADAYEPARSSSLFFKRASRAFLILAPIGKSALESGSIDTAGAAYLAYQLFSWGFFGSASTVIPAAYLGYQLFPTQLLRSVDTAALTTYFGTQLFSWRFPKTSGPFQKLLE